MTDETKPQNFKQELVAAFGQPISENPTQVMMEAAFRHHGLDWRYLTIEVAPDGLSQAVAGARAMGFRGFNCTIPHKVAVIPHLDALGDSAALMDAVNYVVRRGDELVGENTDGKGFVEALRRIRDPAGETVMLLGAGGAARAIAVELALAGVRRFFLVNRSQARRDDLASLLAGPVSRTLGETIEVTAMAWEGDVHVPDGTGMLVNATSIGLYPDTAARIALDIRTLKPGMVVADVIPNPARTRLIDEAEGRGATVIDGLGMLVGQGRIGIEYWTGISPNEAVMRDALARIFA